MELNNILQKSSILSELLYILLSTPQLWFDHTFLLNSEYNTGCGNCHDCLKCELTVKSSVSPFSAL